MSMKQATGWKPEVPTLDADEEDKEEVIQEVVSLQNQYKLGDAHMYQSSQDSYHIYFFYDSARDREEILEIIRDAEFVDKEFQEFQEERDKTRMRVKGKHKEEIKELGVIESEHPGKGLDQRAEHLIRTFRRMKKIKPVD